MRWSLNVIAEMNMKDSRGLGVGSDGVMNQPKN